MYRASTRIRAQGLLLRRTATISWSRLGSRRRDISRARASVRDGLINWASRGH